MSDELRLSASINFSKGSALINRAMTVTLDVTGDAYCAAVQNIGTSPEQVVQMSEVGDPGYLLVKNLDSTNYVELSCESGATDWTVKIPAGGIALFRPGGNTVYGKANTSAVTIEYVWIEV